MISTSYHFDKSPYIHPLIIKDLSTWLSDTGDQVVAINLTESQGSNRYCCERDIKILITEEGKPFISVEEERKSFGYYFVGTTDSGIHVLYTSEWRGGSGVFSNLMFVKFEEDLGVSDNDLSNTIKIDKKRLLLKKIGEYGLGDRYNGKISVEGNTIYIGKDEGWFAQSGGNGGGEIKENFTLTITD